MDEQKIVTKKFSIAKRAKSFVHAGRGVGLFLKTTHNSWIQIVLFCLAIFLGYYFSITETQWIFLMLTGGFVFSAEAFNTAIEIDIDLTSPEYHLYARNAKDVAAGAVLIASVTSAIIGVIIFLPHIVSLFK